MRYSSKKPKNRPRAMTKRRQFAIPAISKQAIRQRAADRLRYNRSGSGCLLAFDCDIKNEELDLSDSGDGNVRKLFAIRIAGSTAVKYGSDEP